MPTVGLRPRVRRHLLTLPRSAVKTYLRQASWLMATSDVPPPSHPIRAVAYSSASLRTLTGGRLTNYSGGTAPDSHRISFSARSPRFHNLSKNRGSRATGRHFVSVSVVNALSVSGRLIPVKPLHRVAGQSRLNNPPIIYISACDERAVSRCSVARSYSLRVTMSLTIPCDSCIGCLLRGLESCRSFGSTLILSVTN